MLNIENGNLRDIFDLIDIANDSSNLLAMRYNVLKFITPLFKASGATFFLPDERLRGIDILSGISYGLDSIYSTLYKQYYYKLEPFNEVISSNQICTTSTINFTPQQWEILEYYNDFLKPQKIHHELIICIRSEGKLFGKIGIFRQKNNPEFDSRDLEKASLISKHLGSIIKNVKLIEEYEEKTNLYRVLTEFPLIAIIILDFNLKPVYHNEAATQMCQQIYEDRSNKGNFALNLDIPIPDAIIQDCLALKNALQTGMEVGSYCRVNDIHTNQGKRYSSKSYYNTQPLRGIQPPSFLILLEDYSEMYQMKEQAARIKFGLTYRELEICKFINEGLANSDIASRLFISHFTVETHIRHIFEKTKARNRTELTKLLGISSN